MTSMPPEIVVVIEAPPPPIEVTVEAPPVISVEVSEVGLVGPPGPDGPPGPPGASAGALLDEHVNDDLPHPAYDDGPSFELLYQNAKV